MKKTIKLEVKKTVESAMTQLLQKVEIAKPSRKTKKAISSVSKKLKDDLKKQLKQAAKKISHSKNGMGNEKANAAMKAG